VLEAYGQPLGLAFQVRDDVLGVFGDPQVTGKDRDGDLREGKQTVLLAKARAMASSDDREFLDEYIGRPDLDPQDADGLRRILLSSGALDHTLELIGRLTERAKRALDPDILEADVTQTLAALADEVSAREA
jgi:geranylgeranyl diphosphate synthase type I